MRTRLVVAACVFGAFIGCSSNPDTSPSLTISPSGSGSALAISGPTDFTATLVNSTDAVTWSVTGGGTLSGSDGFHVSFAPPLGTGSETLTATAGALTASVTIASTPATLTAGTVPGLSAPVTVQYDAEDIPHINCAIALDCFAVQGFIQARDRFFPMDFLRHVARSNLAELIGLDGLSQDVQLRTLFITRDGKRLEGELVKAMDPQTAAVVASFTSGVNAYLTQLAAAGGALPGEYQQLPFPLTPADIAPWTPQDTMALARLEQFELSESLDEESEYGKIAATYLASSPDKVNAYVRAAAPPTEQAHTLAAAPFSLRTPAAKGTLPARNIAKWASVLGSTNATFKALKKRLRPMGAAVGSNNWVVGSAKSATGVSMVANDPHLGLQYPPLFHLSVMTSATASDNLNLAGGAFPGLPGALVGRGAHVGWGVTVVGYDVTDLYLEQIQVSGCPAAPIPCVKFNGSLTSVLPVPETYNARIGPGLGGIVDVTSTLPAAEQTVLIVPQHGPIISADSATGTAVSVRWTGQEGNTDDLAAFLGLDTATDVDSAVTALKNYATGAQNFVLADDAGHIAYDPHALVPVRRFADVTLHGANVIPPWFPVPGDGTAEWGDGTNNCAATGATPVAATCWLADAVLPQGKDPAKGYFFTANSDPTNTGSNGGGVSDGNNPLAFPPYMSFDWDDSSGFRATRIDQLLNAAITGHGNVTEADMEAIQSDHVSRLGKVFTDIIATLPASGDPSDAAARAILAQWATNGWDCPSGLTGSDPNESAADPTPVVQQNSAGCFLFHEFGRTLLNNVFADDIALTGTSLDGLAAVKGMIFMLDLNNGVNTAPEIAAQSTFCNDVDASGATIATHTCEEQVVTALITAYDAMSSGLGSDSTGWVWGRHHTIQPVSLLALVTTNYSPGPFARPGGLFTVDVGNPSLDGGGLDFPYTSGGNVRHISLMDPANPVVKMQLPGPERDGPVTILGPNLIGQWVLNIYFDFAFGAQINAAAVSTQTFTAQ